MQQDRKTTQRERILAGLIEALGSGYAHATISEVIKRAGVSRPTFYEYFADKSTCFQALQAEIQEARLRDLKQALVQVPPEEAVGAALAAIIEFSCSKPELTRILVSEPMAAGVSALDIRDQGLREIAAVIEARYGEVSRNTLIPDLPIRPLLGGLYRLIARRQRNPEANTDADSFLAELLVWLRYYEMPLGEHRWRDLKPSPRLTPTPVVVAPLHPPGPLGNRSRLSKQEVAEHRRQRVLLAAAALAEEKGYSAVTIMDITKRASVDTRAFYGLFADKQGVFRALHELLFRQIIAVTASGFSTVGSWPERVWEAGRAFAQYMECNPVLAHASLVDSHAGDPDTVKLVDQLVGGFTVFLQEGYRYKTQGAPPSALAQQALAATMFEIDYSQVREAKVDELSRLVPHMSFIALAPFLGPAETNTLIDCQLSRHATP